MIPVTRGVLREDVLVRSNNPRLSNAAPAMGTLLEAYERVVNTSLGLHLRVAPKVCQEPASCSGKAFAAKNGVHDGST